MVSEPHRWLVVWLSRKLEREGYTLLAADSFNSPKSILKGLPPSPLLNSIRPDTVAVDRQSQCIAVGDAKTSGDLLTAHTHRQLRAMMALRDRAGRAARVYLAFPQSALALAARAVLRLGLREGLRVRLVPVPDAMLTENPT